MNLQRNAAAVSCLLLLAARVGAFEGNVTYQVTEMNGRTSTLDCKVKGDRVSVTSDLIRGQGTMLLVPKEKTSFTMVPALRLAVKRPLPDARSTLRSLGAVEFRTTERKETVAGVPCAVYTFRTDDAEGEVCATGGLEPLYRAFGTGPWPAWAQEAMKKGLFPLRAKAKDGAGRTFRLTATRIQKMPVPAASMSVPPEFYVTEGVNLGSRE